MDKQGDMFSWLLIGTFLVFLKKKESIKLSPLKLANLNFFLL